MIPTRLSYPWNSTKSLRKKILKLNIVILIISIVSHLDVIIETLDLANVIGNEWFLTGWAIATIGAVILRSGFLALRWLIQRYNRRRGNHG